MNSVFHLEGNAVFTIQDCSEGGTIINNCGYSHTYAVSSSGGIVNLSSGFVSGFDGIFNNCGHVNIFRKNRTKLTLKLQRKTQYFVRVRYVGKDGVSRWSKVKRVKTK